MNRDVSKIALSYSIMLTLLGTPVVYYGDEFGKLNDENYYNEQIKLTGKDDTRFFVRGRIDWEKLELDLKDSEGFHSQVYSIISSMLNIRKEYMAFGRGDLDFTDVVDLSGKNLPEILSYTRTYDNEKILVVNNLSSEEQVIVNPLEDNNLALLNMNGFTMDDDSMVLKPKGFAWFLVV